MVSRVLACRELCHRATTDFEPGAYRSPMAERKTSRNDSDVDAFLSSVDNETRRRDAMTVRDLMTNITGEEAEMWGGSIVGFGP